MVWRGEINNGPKLHQGLGERHERTEIAASSTLNLSTCRSSLSAASPSPTVFLYDEIVDPSYDMVFETLQDTFLPMN